MNRIAALIGVAGLALVTIGGPSSPAGAADPATAGSSFSSSEAISRVHLIDGADKVVDQRTVRVTVSETRDLRDRQAVTVTWNGAHPTGGLVSDHNSGAAALQEYPVVVMQCRGTDSAAVPAAQRVSPETCWTQTPAERFQYSQSGTNYPAYRMDRYASQADRGADVNEPKTKPAACSEVPVPHWIPYVAADGTVYPGGPFGCAGLAPEAANSADSLQPGNTTYGVADGNGNGSTKFVVQNADSNASIGCSNTVACTMVVIPIMGVSCDAAGVAPAPGGMPAPDRPPSSAIPFVRTDCEAAGQFAPGVFNGGGQTPDLAVSGQLWWASSNWRNRISVPLTLAPSASVCDVVSKAATVYLYGAESLLQATQQWAPSFCLNPKLFNVRHVQTSEPQAKNLLQSGNIEAAIQAAPPPAPFSIPTVQAPAAVSGWAIAFSVDDANGNPVANLKLNARLLAKLLSESYRSCSGDCLPFNTKESKHNGFSAVGENPIDMSEDPEFLALNPGIAGTLYRESASTLSFMSSDSDLMYALTSYINADPEARAWLDGTPDPWGMYVNPAYQRIVLPVANWPLLDTHLVNLATGANQCLAANPVPWLPLVSSPILNPAIIALDLQFDIANSQINCKDNGSPTQKLTAIGRQTPGTHFLVGLVSLADARRYQLNVAQLQTSRTSVGDGTFSSAAGRTFVAPTDAALATAAKLFVADDTLGTWTVPYDTLRTSAGAYPGTVLISIDVATRGVAAGDAPRYAQFLRFVAGDGQRSGLQIGLLAPGYVPLTPATGLARFSAYTLRAAAAVQAQKGIVPYVSGRPDPAAPPPPAADGTSGVGAAPGGSTVTAPGATSPGATTGPAAQVGSTSTVPGPAALVGNTSKLSSGALGLALPAFALLALAALGASAYTSGVGRRR